MIDFLYLGSRISTIEGQVDSRYMALLDHILRKRMNYH